MSPSSATLDAASPEVPPAAPAAPSRRRRRRPSTGIELGVATMLLGFIVIIPLGAVVVKSAENGWSGFWADITTPEALSTIQLTVIASLAVGAINAVMGTLIAWLLVRDRFPGKRVIDTLIDLPFALPTVVAGLVLVSLYGTNSPVNLTLAYTRPGVVVALLFVTLPFVVRTVQPVLLELDQEMEQAAASLGAGNVTIFRRIVLPNLVPAILAGTALSFARALGEYGSMGFLSGNIPFETQVSSVQIYSQVENDNLAGAAAVATVLIAVSLVVLVLLGVIQRWAARRG